MLDQIQKAQYMTNVFNFNRITGYVKLHWVGVGLEPQSVRIIF